MQSERPHSQELAVVARADGQPLATASTFNGSGPWSAGSRPPSSDTVPLFQYLAAIYRYKWRIIMFAALCGLVSLIVSLRITPLYESTVVIDIDRQSDVDPVGADSRGNNSINVEQFIATQIRLVQSDSVLRPVALRHQQALQSSEPWLSERNEEGQPLRTMAPATLERLKVTNPPQTFLIYIRYRSPDPQLSASVANEIAQSYIDHVFRIRYESSQTLSVFMERQLEELRAKMESSNEALAAFERELNMIDPEERTSIISSRLMQLNTEYTHAQAERVKREAAFRALSQGSMEAATISAHGEQLQELQRRQQELLEAFARVKQHYGPNHPAYASAKAELDQVTATIQQRTASVQRQIGLGFDESVQREQLLGQELRATKAEFDHLNASSFQYKTLKREADADRKLYEELVAKTKQATINSGFPSSAIRIADLARPAYKPVSPKIPINVLLAFLFGLMLSVGVALIADTMDSTVRDPEMVSSVIGSEVLGALPKVRGAGSQLVAAMLNEGAPTPSRALVPLSEAQSRPVQDYLESVRTLHASLMLADLSQQLRTLMVSSAAPSEGKSTVAATIAISHAARGKRVLLIDGDLRRPSLAQKLGVPNDRGLVDVCLKALPWRDAVQPLSQQNLHLLSTGFCNRRAIDPFVTVLADLLAEASAEYDLVVVDSPPLLGFPEPLHMAALVDGVMMVALAGSTNRKALQLAINQLRRIGANSLGVVVNGLSGQSPGSYYYRSYSSHYQEQDSDGAGTEKRSSRKASAFDEETKESLAS